MKNLLNPFRRRRKFPPRHTIRDVPYRPPAERRSDAGGLALIYEFFSRYMLPHWRNLGLCILLATLSSCSVYLMSYYGKIVIDQILVVTEGGSGTSRRVPVVQARQQAAPVTRPFDRGVIHGRAEKQFQQLRQSSGGRDLRLEAGQVSERYRSLNASPRPPQAGRKLFKIFMIYLCTVLLLNIGARIVVRARVKVAEAMTLCLREDMHKKIISLSSGFHQRMTPGRLMARILSDVDIVRENLLNIVQTASSQIIMFLVGVGILSFLEWRCMVAVVVSMIPYSYVINLNRKHMRVVNFEMRHSNACLWGLVSQKLDSIRAIYTYGREKSEMRNFFRLSAVLQRDALEQQRLGASLGRSAHVIAMMTTRGIFVYCTLKVLEGQMSFGRMMYIYGAASNLFTPIVNLTHLTASISHLLVILQRMTLMLRNPNVIQETPDAVDFPVPLKRGVVVDNVSFRFDEDSDPVLSNISFEVPAGQWFCIMGPSGSGKTTLLNLLARLYDPTDGAIRVDDIPMPEIKIQSLRNHMAMVPQEAQILSGTLRDNIAYGHPRATPNEIMAAAKAADCHDFIMNLPVKYETIVGEKGATLSGGQRQRVSIARALLSNPDVLVLDDCTSALDANTERRLQVTLTKLLEGKTAIMASQRVSMAMRCHRIIVLEDGHITERGTHEQLLQRGGFYARLCKEQLG